MFNQTSLLPNLKDASSLVSVQLADVFNIIRTDPQLKTVSQHYLSIPDQNIEERKSFKPNHFPSFFPTVWLGNTKQNTLTDNAIPTGLIQFDLDTKDNPLQNIPDIKKQLLLIPELYSLFLSPSGGLKFTIKTDFHKHHDDTLNSLKYRYKVAYGIVQSRILQAIPGLILDPAVGHLKFACFLSHDPDAILNIECDKMILDHRCYAPDQPKERMHTFDTVDVEKVKELLSFIPKDFTYMQRLPVNGAVFNAIGEKGESILLNHWTTSNKVKLKKDLSYQLKHTNQMGIGYLFKIARLNGYPRSKTGRARKSLQVRNIFEATLETGQLIEGLKTWDEAQEVIKKTVERFINKKSTMALSSSVGIGKTEKVLLVLRELSWQNRVLFVSNNHSLLTEVNMRFNNIKKDGDMKSQSCMNHIQGRSRLCENEQVIKLFDQTSIPHQQCIHDCPFFAQCRYTIQFDHYSNIRLMAADDLYNDSSYFDSSDWKPDYIIIDEDCQKLEVFDEKLDCRWKSLRYIISEIEDGLTLEAAIDKHMSHIIIDYAKMKSECRSRNSQWVSSELWIQEMKEKQDLWSEILLQVYRFSLSGDTEDLHGLRPCHSKDQVWLRLSRLRGIHRRWKDTPMLFMDATADEHVIKHLYPDIEWVSAHAIKKHSTKLIQAENFTITKNFLEKKENRELLIDGLKRFIVRGNQSGNENKPFKKVGLITYKNIPGVPDWDMVLGDALGADVVDHFGNIRGKNKFESCDLLIIAGRHEIPPFALDDYCYAIYGQPRGGVEGDHSTCQEYAEVPVRMSDHRWVVIENYIYHHKQTESVRNHVCKAETHQAAGRIRWFLDHPDGLNKTVLLLSSESLGMNVEVDGWIRREDLLDIPKEVKSKEDIKIEGLKKQKANRLENEFQKRLSLLSYRGLPDVVDHYRAFEDLGFGITFSQNKSARRDFMIQAGYKLTDMVWSVHHD